MYYLVHFNLLQEEVDPVVEHHLHLLEAVEKVQLLVVLLEWLAVQIPKFLPMLQDQKIFVHALFVLFSSMI